MKKDTWLIVTNSSIARIFKVSTNKSIVEIESLIHPESRMHNRDLRSDKPGRSFESSNAKRHSLESTVMPKQTEFINFAIEIANYLEQGRNEGKFKKLYLVAGPSQLGLLRQHLHPETIKLIEGEVDKDITHLKPEEIISHLPFILTL